MELPGLGLNSAASSRKTLNFQSSCLSQPSSFDDGLGHLAWIGRRLWLVSA